MEGKEKSKPKRWSRKRQVQARYGNVCARTIDRAVADKRLPSPKFPFGNKVPFWDDDELDEHDRAAAMARPKHAAAMKSPTSPDCEATT
jgi:hypothetical protein